MSENDTNDNADFGETTTFRGKRSKLLSRGKFSLVNVQNLVLMLIQRSPFRGHSRAD